MPDEEVPGLAAQQPAPGALPLDELDLRILAAHVAHPESTVKALAAALGVAESTCAYRLRQLREKGVVRGLRVSLDMTRLGYPVQAVIRVRLGSHTKARVDALFDALEVVPGVIRVFHVAGVDDFLVHVAVTDAGSLRDVVLEHITIHDVVRGTETQLVFEMRDGRRPLAGSASGN